MLIPMSRLGGFTRAVDLPISLYRGSPDIERNMQDLHEL